MALDQTLEKILSLQVKNGGAFPKPRNGVGGTGICQKISKPKSFDQTQWVHIEGLTDTLRYFDYITLLPSVAK